ncbi:MAG: VCBS repeat-containing protein [Nannocystaceae bacterium]|nr:VCBS repeat-containing protein [Nannocystaceae bacterium]
MVAVGCNGSTADQANRARVLLGDGAGGFTLDPVFPDTHHFYGFETADLDGDGLDDLVVRGHFQQVPEHPTFSIVMNRGDAGWEVMASPFDGFADAIGVFDITGDDLVDVYAVLGTDVGRVYPGDGMGGVGAPFGDNAVGVDPGTELDVADVTGDGRLDITIADSGIFGIWGYIFRNDAGALVDNYSPFPALRQRVSLADLNDNGLLDALVTEFDGASAFRNDGDGTFTLMQALPATDGADGIAAADFDDDGLVDAIVIVEEQALLMRGLGGFDFEQVGDAQVGSGPSVFRHIELGDFNEDGVPDALVSSHGTAVLLLSDP